MNYNPVGWFEIYVQNMARAKLFYESVLQVTLERLDKIEPEMWCFPMTRDRIGAGGALVKMDGVPSGGNSTLVYFNCEDCAVETSRVTANGGKVHREKFSIDQYGFISLVFDTEGNMIGLHSRQ
ncbi:MAG: VOC family protein [Betaproteobacteria bacterium]